MLDKVLLYKVLNGYIAFLVFEKEAPKGFLSFFKDQRPGGVSTQNKESDYRLLDDEGFFHRMHLTAFELIFWKSLIIRAKRSHSSQGSIIFEMR